MYMYQYFSYCVSSRSRNSIVYSLKSLLVVVAQQTWFTFTQGIPTLILTWTCGQLRIV